MYFPGFSELQVPRGMITLALRVLGVCLILPPGKRYLNSLIISEFACFNQYVRDLT